MNKDVKRVLLSFDMNPTSITQIECLRRHANHATYRICLAGYSVILKLFDESNPVELEAYRLLAQYDVITLPILGTQKQAILLEDISTGSEWHLATEQDVIEAKVGTAVAEWYKSFHNAGFQAVADGAVEHIKDWVSILTPDSLFEAGEVLGVNDQAAWKLAIDHIDFFKAAVRAQPQTFNYNDFYFTNLALSLDVKRPLSAIVFDYDLFSLGPVYSDWRNVMSGLLGEAKEAFVEAYGSVDKIYKLLDDPLSTIEGLVVSAQRSKFPQWGISLKEDLFNGKLEQHIQTAIATLR